MAAALDDFAHDPAIRTVAVRSSSPRAFCAGADIRRVHEHGKEGRQDAQLHFLRDEFRNCYRINTYPKPYVALIDGIVMGGGAGISIHGAHRVVGDGATFAMPETAIGFFPDIGASFFLPRLPDRFGTYLAMTAARINLGDVLALGLATAHVPSARFDLSSRNSQPAKTRRKRSHRKVLHRRLRIYGKSARSSRAHLPFPAPSEFSPRLPMRRIAGRHLRKPRWRLYTRARHRASRLRCGRCSLALRSIFADALKLDYRIAATNFAES